MSSLAVRRPVATSMLTLAAVLIGVVSLGRLEVTLLPEIGSGRVLVWVGWAEAGVPEIEEAVARPVEEAVLSAPGVRRVSSRTVPGGASFTVELHADADPELVALAIRERLDRVRWTFPEGVDTPVVLGDLGEAEPVLVLALASDDLPSAAEWARAVLAPRLEQIDGVARAHVTGAPTPEIRVDADPDRLRAAGLDVARLGDAIRAADVASPGGTVRRLGIRYALEVESRLETASDVAAVRVTGPGEPKVLVSDVARVTDGFADPEGWSRLDGRRAVGVLVYRAAGRNLLRVADRVHDELERLRSEFPELSMAVVSDPAPFVRQSISGVWQAVWLGGLLAFSVLFAFLRDPRSPAFLVLALPVSVIATFAVLEACGVSLNLMSLGGIALGVGMLVDNSIVCLENIDSKRAAGLPPAEAASAGAKEISLPVLASTLTTCAVFVPLSWVPGAVGELFRDQAIAVSVSLLVSLVVAITLLPVLSARFAPREAAEARLPLYGAYHRLLGRCLDRPARSLGVAFVALVASLAILAGVPREIFPSVATDHLRIRVRLPEGSDVTATDGAVRRIESWLGERNGVASVFASVGAVGSLDPGDPARRMNRAEIRATLARDGVAGRAGLIDDLVAAFAAEPWSLEVVPDMPELAALLRGGGAALTLDVTGPDAEVAEEIARELAAEAAVHRPADGYPLTLVASEREPRLRVSPREDVQWRYGLEERAAVSSIEAATSGYRAARLRRFDEEVPVTIRVPAATSLAAATTVVGGREFPVSELFDVGVEVSPASILRDAQSRVASVRWDGPLRSVVPTLRALERAVDGTELPPGYRVSLGGSYREMRETLHGVLRAFALSAGLVLLVLAAQFESLRLPLVIFAAVPLSLVGVAAVLLATGGTLNALSGIGIVVLVGIVVNDAILKVDVLSRLRRAGMPRREAILTAGRKRYRPILMTTLTTTLGLAPLFFGRGAELRAPLAATVIGGLLSATFLTLLVVPLLYDRVTGGKAP